MASRLPGGDIKTERRTGELMKSPFKFKKYGQCGMDVSELWPHLGEVADDICWIRSVYTEIPNHEPVLSDDEHRRQPSRPALDGRLDYLRAGDGESESSRVRRALPRHSDHRRSAFVEQRIPAGDPPGNLHFQSRADRAAERQLDDMPTSRMPAETMEKDKDGKEKPKKVVIEKEFRSQEAGQLCEQPEVHV